MRHVIVLAGMVFAASSAGAVSFVNGSFEQSINPGKSVLLSAGDGTSITGWKVASGNIDLVGSAWDAADGAHSIDLSGIEPGSIIQTLHGLSTGTKYQITFDLSGSYTVARTAPNRAAVQVDGFASQIYSYDLNNFVNNMMYTPETYLFTATSSVAVVHFSGLDRGDYGAVLDNVGISLAPTITSVGGTVPEPAVWAMMIGGFGLTGTAMRRRSKALAV